MKNVSILLFALASYVSFVAVSVWMVLFLLGFGRDAAADEVMAWPVAVSIDLGLITLFGIAHSIMARPWFKSRWTRILSPAAERPFYVLQSSVLLALIFGHWQPIPVDVWRLDALVANIALVCFGMGLVIIVLATILLDHFEFTGLRQAWYNLRNIPMPAPRFRTPLLYRLVRHPLQSGILITMFSVPRMTLDGLLFAVAMTVYIVVGLYFEERALMREFGPQYRAYRARVPMLFPRVPGFGRSGQRSRARSTF